MVNVKEVVEEVVAEQEVTLTTVLVEVKRSSRWSSSRTRGNTNNSCSWIKKKGNEEVAEQEGILTTVVVELKRSSKRSSSRTRRNTNNSCS